MPFNASAYEIYNENLNSQSNVREVLIQYMNNLLITTPNSIKLQSASLAELTQSTNQLTRQTLVNLSSKYSFSKIHLLLFLANGIR